MSISKTVVVLGASANPERYSHIDILEACTIVLLKTGVF